MLAKYIDLHPLFAGPNDGHWQVLTKNLDVEFIVVKNEVDPMSAVMQR